MWDIAEPTERAVTSFLAVFSLCRLPRKGPRAAGAEFRPVLQIHRSKYRASALPQLRREFRARLSSVGQASWPMRGAKSSKYFRDVPYTARSMPLVPLRVWHRTLQRAASTVLPDAAAPASRPAPFFLRDARRTRPML